MTGKAAHPRAGGPAGSGGPDSIFEASGFERYLEGEPSARGFGWRRQTLVVAAVLACLALFALARWLAATPSIDGDWQAGLHGELLLSRSADDGGPASRNVIALSARGAPALPVDALLLHRWPRWQVDDALRQRQIAQHEGLARLLEQAPDGRLRLHFADGGEGALTVVRRGYAGLGWGFWPLAGLALLLYLFSLVLVLARPHRRNLAYFVMALCQAGNLLFIAVESAHGLGLPAGWMARDLPLRVMLDLFTAAAAVHSFSRPRAREGWPGWAPALAWATVPAWWLLVAHAGIAPLWWTAQAVFLGIGFMSLGVAALEHRRQPNPHTLVLRRLTTAAMVSLALMTLAVALAAGNTGTAPSVAAVASVSWHLFVASLLLLTPFLARRRQLLREFALLAGLSTVVTSLDLLFVVSFSFSTFTSLALAVFIGLGLYAAARQWVVNHLIGASVLTTERTFDLIYRAAREVQARPRRYAEQLAQLLGELFEPLEVLRVERVPVRARLLGGGSALVVPMRKADEAPAGASDPSMALVLRHAQRGQRLFTVEDARLADRVVEQLRRAVAYDAAVERGRSEERQRIAQDLHDDIGARLLTLMYQAQTREMEDYIRHTLQDLKTLTRGLAAAEHRLSHAAGEWKADLAQRLSIAQAALVWNFSVDHDRRLSVVQWSALTRVLRELVTNALFHGHATQVTVDFSLEGDLLTLQVADNGEGRAPEQWAHGLGLGGVRKRVKLLGGEVGWRESPAGGIVCSVRVPDFSHRP